jgi:uncharacterized protein (TIGR02996 family)
MTVVRSLGAARDAVAAGQLASALDHVLDAWRATPAEAIADLVASIGDRARRHLLPPSGRTARDRDAAWHALARDANAVTRGVLVEHLGDGNVAQTLARVELLAAGPTDPRFAAKVGDFVERPIFNASLPRTTAFWRRIFELLPKLGDPRLVVRARRFPSSWLASPDLTPSELAVFPRRFEAAMPAIVAAYGEGPPALADDAAALCRDISRAIATIDREADAALAVAHDALLDGRDSLAREVLAEVPEDALLAAVFAAPDDDEPRRIYADWLVRRGDPRGELIQLQLARRAAPPSRDAVRREKALLDEHKTTWLGPLAAMIKTPKAVFERGFLDACALKGTWVQRLDDDPRWATVRSLELGNSGIIQLAAITRPLVIESLIWELRLGQGPDYGNEAAVAAFRRLQLPRLRRVEIWGNHFMGAFDRRQLETAPFASQLELFEITAR